MEQPVSAGNGIMRYFGIWVDEQRKTREEPDGTACTMTSILILSSPPSSLQYKIILTCDAVRSYIMERKAGRMFWCLLTPSLLAATLIGYWQFKRRSWSEGCVKLEYLRDVKHNTYTIKVTRQM
jgi:hypothetical protein